MSDEVHLTYSGLAEADRTAYFNRRRTLKSLERRRFTSTVSNEGHFGLNPSEIPLLWDEDWGKETLQLQKLSRGGLEAILSEFPIDQDGVTKSEGGETGDRSYVLSGTMSNEQTMRLLGIENPINPSFRYIYSTGPGAQNQIARVEFTANSESGKTSTASVYFGEVLNPVAKRFIIEATQTNDFGEVARRKVIFIPEVPSPFGAKFNPEIDAKAIQIVSLEMPFDGRDDEELQTINTNGETLRTLVEIYTTAVNRHEFPLSIFNKNFKGLTIIPFYSQFSLIGGKEYDGPIYTADYIGGGEGYWKDGKFNFIRVDDEGKILPNLYRDNLEGYTDSGTLVSLLENC